MTTPTLISIKTAVERTGLSEHTLRYYVRTGKLPAWRISGRRIGIEPAAIEALIEPYPVKPSKTA